MSNWQYSDDYEFQYTETSDPRVFACVMRDADSMLSPADFYMEPEVVVLRADGWSYADLWGDSDMVGIVQRALLHFGESLGGIGSGSKTDRYLRLFHNVTDIYHVGSMMDRYVNVIVLALDGTPYAKGVAQDWEDYINGDVYRVGSAVIPSRVAGAPVTAEQVRDACNIECWGYYGEAYARESAQEEAGYTIHDLPPMLPGEDE